MFQNLRDFFEKIVIWTKICKQNILKCKNIQNLKQFERLEKVV